MRSMTRTRSAAGGSRVGAGWEAEARLAARPALITREKGRSACTVFCSSRFPASLLHVQPTAANGRQDAFLIISRLRPRCAWGFRSMRPIPRPRPHSRAAVSQRARAPLPPMLRDPKDAKKAGTHKTDGVWAAPGNETVVIMPAIHPGSPGAPTSDCRVASGRGATMLLTTATAAEKAAAVGELLLPSSSEHCSSGPNKSSDRILREQVTGFAPEPVSVRVSCRASPLPARGHFYQG